MAKERTGIAAADAVEDPNTWPWHGRTEQLDSCALGTATAALRLLQVAFMVVLFIMLAMVTLDGSAGDAQCGWYTECMSVQGQAGAIQRA